MSTNFAHKKRGKKQAPDCAVRTIRGLFFLLRLLARHFHPQRLSRRLEQIRQKQPKYDVLLYIVRKLL